MRQMIAGNFKMNGRLADVAGYASAMAAAPAWVDVLVCPPFPLLERFAALLAGTGVALGAQDCHAAAAGAHTGDVAAGLLREIGALYVILGHSERRAAHHEGDADIAAKVTAAMQAGLIPIACVGETEAARDAGAAEAVVRQQLRHSLPDGFAGMVAYEPIWAIGTGRTPTEADIAAMHAAIRADLRDRFGEDGGAIRILYGGSVKPGNAGAILAIPEVGGALVGGACLDPADLLAIAAAATAD
jgi:triosephosphate isomerase